MDINKRDYKARRVVRDYEEDEEWQEQKDREEEQEKGKKQKERQVQEKEMFTLQERVGSLRSLIEFKEMNEQDWEDERKCQELKQAWLRDFPEVFKEDLGKEDRIDMDPVVVDLVPNHEEIKVFHPKLSTDVPAYLQKAA